MVAMAIEHPRERQPELCDTTGERCRIRPVRGPVLLLPATWGDPATRGHLRESPEGAAIYVPAFGVTCSTVEPPPFFGRNRG